MKRFQKLLICLAVLSILVVSCAPQPVATPAPTQPPAVETEPPAPTQPPAVETEPPAPPAEAPIIKVGALLPLTGTDAINGQNQQHAHNWAVEKINANGGIQCLGGAQLEMVYGDSQGRPESGNSETERLITRENVITVMGAFHSGVTLTATEIAERYQVPFIVPNALAGAITERGLKYVFKTAVSIEQMASDSANFAADLGAGTAVVLTPNITFGEEFAKSWTRELETVGITLTRQIGYPAGASDFSDAILALRAADPDIILTIGNTADATLLIRQMKEQNYWPRMGVVTAAGGFADPTLVRNLGVDANGLFLTNDWFPNINRAGAKELNDQFKARFGLDMTGNINTTYAAMWVLYEALEKACSTDPAALAEVLRTTRFEGGNYSFMYPAVEFDEKGFNRYTSNVIAQIQDGVPMVVWPTDLAVAEAVWPVPAWDQR
ncbi:MAG: ABC transporter substrate-binding protein [Bellilinea sp.]|jgi:branched-chain amino acid transport system substrate-binding protein